MYTIGFGSRVNISAVCVVHCSYFVICDSLFCKLDSGSVKFRKLLTCTVE